MPQNNITLGHVEHRHNDIERVGQNEDGAGRFEYPLEENPIVQVQCVLSSRFFK